MFDACIIGGGPVGLFMAQKLHDAGMNYILLEAAEHFGGQCEALYANKPVYNIPLIEKINAGDIIKKMLQNTDKERIFFSSCVNEIHKIEDVFKIKVNVNKENYREIETKKIIIASGNGEIVPNKLPISGAEKLENKSIFYKITNPEIFKDKNVVIAGGGNSTIDASIMIADVVKTLTIVHRREIINQDNNEFLLFEKLVKDGKIKILHPYSISKIDSEQDELKSVDIANISTKETQKLVADKLLVFFGLKNSMNSMIKNYIGEPIETRNCAFLVNEHQETSIKNIFAVGDCCIYEGKIKNMLVGFAECAKCSTFLSKSMNI